MRPLEARNVHFADAERLLEEVLASQGVHLPIIKEVFEVLAVPEHVLHDKTEVFELFVCY